MPRLRPRPRRPFPFRLSRSAAPSTSCRIRHWSGRGSRDAADPLTERQPRRAQRKATPLEPEGARPPEKTERLSRLISSAANDGSRVLDTVSLTCREQNELNAGCALTWLRPHFAIGSPPRRGISAASGG